jgi:opacity protein-like surface antigen
MSTAPLAMLVISFPGLGFSFLHASSPEGAPEQPEAVQPAPAGSDARWNPELSLAATTPSVDPAPASAAPQEGDVRRGTYFHVGAGLVTMEESDGPDEEIDFDEGYMITLGVGHRWADAPEDELAFGAELEGIWTDQDADDDPPIQALRDITVIAVMLNGLLDYQFTEAFGLYGGAGIGTAWMDVGTESDAFNDFEDEDGPFLAWQAKAGLQLATSPSLVWNLGYRFLNIDDVEIDDDLGGAEFDLETTQHILELGASFGF